MAAVDHWTKRVGVANRGLRRHAIGAAASAGLLALASAPALADSLEAALSRPEVRLGETVDLLLRYRPDEGAGLPGAPDLAALEQDFQVLDRRQSQRTTIVNGQRDASLDWVITLAPRRAGAAAIPALAVGDARSRPLDLQVAAAQSASAAAADGRLPDLFLETEVDRSDPYVQGQAVLTARIYDAAGITSAALTDPQVPGAVVERLGEDRAHREQRGGRDYRVIERRFGIFPQASGPLEIPPLQLEAQLPAEPGAAGGFGGGFGRPGFPSSSFPSSGFFGGGTDPFAEMFARMRQQGFGAGFGDPFAEMFGRRVRVLSQPLTLEVREQPASATGDWWLPAEEVQLVEDWSSDSFRVGEPATRTITLLARGLTGAQLPDLPLPDAPGVKQYVEDTGRQTVARGGNALTARQMQVSVIPTEAGQVRLPEIRVTWWDVVAEQERVAVLPARSLTVAAAAGGQAVPAAAAPVAAPVAASPGRADPEAAADGRPPASWLRDPRLWGAAVAGLLLLAAGGAAVLRRHRRRLAGSGRATGPGTDRAALRAAEEALAGACRAGDGAAVLDALARWGRLRWPAAPPRSARAVADRLQSAALRQAVQALSASVYGGGAASESGEGAAAALLTAFRDARRLAVPAAKRRAAVPPLYPAAGSRPAPAA